MNKILVLSKQEEFLELLRSYYEHYGFCVMRMNALDFAEDISDTHIIVINLQNMKIPLGNIIERAKTKYPDIKIACYMQKFDLDSNDRLEKQRIDAIFSERNCIEEIDRKIKALMFPEKYDDLKGQELRDIRKQCGMTIVQLSEITAISQKNIALYEQGKTSLPKKTVDLLFHTLKWPMGFSDN